MVNIKKEDVKKLEDTFNPLSDKQIKTNPCRIRFNGKFIQVSSGKTIWRQKGFAKNALNNHISTCRKSDLPEYVIGQNGYVDKQKLKEYLQELENQKILEYVDVDMDEFAQEKD